MFIHTHCNSQTVATSPTAEQIWKALHMDTALQQSLLKLQAMACCCYRWGMPAVRDMAIYLLSCQVLCTAPAVVGRQGGFKQQPSAGCMCHGKQGIFESARCVPLQRLLFHVYARSRARRSFRLWPSLVRCAGRREDVGSR